jgi:hypothetical protein
MGLVVRGGGVVSLSVACGDLYGCGDASPIESTGTVTCTLYNYTVVIGKNTTYLMIIQSVKETNS